MKINPPPSGSRVENARAGRSSENGCECTRKLVSLANCVSDFSACNPCETTGNGVEVHTEMSGGGGGCVNKNVDNEGGKGKKSNNVKENSGDDGAVGWVGGGGGVVGGGGDDGEESRDLVFGYGVDDYDKHTFVSENVSEEMNGNDGVHDYVKRKQSECEIDARKSNLSISFLHWNISGLVKKLYCSSFVQFISSFDIVCMVETFVDKFENTIFVDHKEFVKPAIKLEREGTNPGRRSGGVIVLVRKSLLPYVHHKKCDSSYSMFFMLDKVRFGFDKNVLLVCSYIPPEHSPYYPLSVYDNGIDMLEESVIEKLLSLNDCDVLMCGDFNARTSNNAPLNVNLDSDSICFKRDENEETLRRSEDNVVNSYGRKLLDFCTSLGLTIFNGVCNGDLEGRYTFIGDSGSSTNDYFIGSLNLFNILFYDLTLKVEERIESDHLPVVLYVNKQFRNNDVNKDNKTNEKIIKYIWDENVAGQFCLTMNNQVVREKMQVAEDLIEIDMNKALMVFNDIVKEQAECMKKTITGNKDAKKHDWFDYECILARRKVRRLLKTFRKTLDKGDRVLFCISRREYKNLILRKRKEHNSSLLNELLKTVDNQKEFWSSVNKISSKKSQPSNNISVEQWFQHFKGLLEKDDIATSDSSAVEHDYVDELDRPISKEEVLLAIRKLKHGKSAGPDGLIAEFFRNSGELTVCFLVKLFNYLFDEGIYPNSWTESIIIPLFKKGDVNDVNNYRGISLSNISSKIYSSIINTRLQEWIKRNNITGEHQAGFKNNYSTTDHIFTLMAAVQKQFTHNRKLYVAFVDFEKAFDSISRKLLWPILLKNSIKGKLYRCLRSMYDEVKARVKSGSILTDFVNCTRGVKQGDVCSPILFSLFMNELALEIIEKGKHGVTFDLVELFILLFADDIILLSITVVGLQRQLNNLYFAASRHQLKVNMSKTSIIVFRKGGYLARNENWTYGNNNICVVNAYKYLGIYFSTRLSFSHACCDISSRAKKAVISILKLLYRLDCTSFKIFCRLFDTKVQSILQYGAEIWAFENTTDEIEKVHLFAMKRFLNVANCTPNDLVYGDLGRYPIYLNSYMKCIKYWLKLTRMDEYRLPYKAYKMLYNLDNSGKKTWATNVRQYLYTYGFAYVWDNQGVGNIAGFLHCFKQRIIDCRWQNWHEHVHTSDRFTPYAWFKNTHEIESYIELKLNRYVKSALTKFRFGISDIASHRFRYSKREDCDIRCRLCNTGREEEVHFLFCCPALSDLREKLIQSKYYSDPCMFRFIILMSATNESVLNNLAFYVYEGLKRLRVVT